MSRDWDADLVTAGDVLRLLEGSWQGEGEGGYPTVESFTYREKLTFERRDEESLFYMQRTAKQMPGTSEFVLSHWESGFIRVLSESGLELANVQSGGRGEVLIGTIAMLANKIRLDFTSKSMTNDERMIATTRTFVIEGDRLQYEMSMQTNRVNQLTQHLLAVLRRTH
jgi:THAP domain-containing protein 4